MTLKQDEMTKLRSASWRTKADLLKAGVASKPNSTWRSIPVLKAVACVLPPPPIEQTDFDSENTSPPATRQRIDIVDVSPMVILVSNTAQTTVTYLISSTASFTVGLVHLRHLHLCYIQHLLIPLPQLHFSTT